MVLEMCTHLVAVFMQGLGGACMITEGFRCVTCKALNVPPRTMRTTRQLLERCAQVLLQHRDNQ